MVVKYLPANEGIANDSVLDLAHRDLSAVLGSVIKKTTYTI